MAQTHMITISRCIGGCLVAASLGLGAQTTTPINLSPVEARDPGSTLADGWQRGAFMEIFVRGYRDSDGDGIGDLRGVTQSLDYLQRLGIRGIWLMPITTSSDRDHGYATTDFRRIEQQYGTLEDFDTLLREAHARGIGVIMDYVINHSAAEHPLFVSAVRGADQPFRDWFVWQDIAPMGWEIWGNDPWIQTSNGAYMATFGPHMPDFNFRNPAVVQYHKDSLRFWLNRGLDGYRLDAVPHLIENNAKDWNDQPESRRLTGELRSLINAYSKRYTVCEATAKPQDYAAPDLCASSFAFGHQYELVKAAKGDAKAIEKVAQYFVTAPAGMATFLSNHDRFGGERMWDQFQGNLAQYRLAAATYLLQPGIPFLYYGEEIGLAGAKGLRGDGPLRSPMSWTSDPQRAGFTTGQPYRPIAPNSVRYNAAAQQKDAKSLWAYYRDLLQLRNAHPALSNGDYQSPFVEGKLMGFQRTDGAQTALVLINYDKKAARTSIPLQMSAQWKQVFPPTGKPVKTVAGGKLAVVLPAQSVQVLVRQP
jgi:alpha-amylase